MKFNKVNAIGSIQIQRLTTSKRIAIANPEAGRVVFDTSDSKIYVGDGSSWIEVGTGGGGGGGAAMQIDTFVSGTATGNYTGGLATFELQTITYTAGANEILVFSNMLLMKNTVDFNEHASGDRIIFTSDRTTGERVTVVRIIGSGGSGSSTFVGLTDTPAAYTGQAGKVPIVNTGETALEFGTVNGIETVASLPVWSASDEGRAIYTDNTNKLYYGNDAGWQEVIETGGVVMEREEFVGTDGSGGNAIFTLSAFTYNPGSDEILVFSNNVLMKLGAGEDYLESAADTITFNQSRADDEKITVLKFNPGAGGGGGGSGDMLAANNLADVISATASFDNIAPTTIRGDLITRDATNNVRLAIGTNGQVLTSDGTDVSWATPSGNIFRQTVTTAAGEEIEILKMGTGTVTYVRAGTTGTFTVPASTRILAAKMRLPMGTIGGTSFTVVYGTNGGFDLNSNFGNMFIPMAQDWNESTGVQVAISTNILAGFDRLTITGLGFGVNNLVRLQW